MEELKVKNIESEEDGSDTNIKDASRRTQHPEGGEEISDNSDNEIDDLLDKVPPDFELAERHRDANRVKNISENIQEERLYDDEKDF